MTDVVLDASAVLALLNREPGHEQVAGLLPGALIGTVNLAEVLSKLCERGVPPDAAMEAVGCLGLELVAYTDGQALRTGEFPPLTKPFGLSLGDRACLALARERQALADTAERRWNEEVAGLLEVEILRIRHG